MTPLYRVSWPASALQAAHPPQWRNEQKRVVAARLSPPQRPWVGTVTVTRWAPAVCPEPLAPALPVEAFPRFFDYPPAAWTVNFADPDLFGYYAGPLLAQDELQCLEIPALAAAREGLLATGRVALTRAEAGPTPILVTGVERRGVLDTRPDLGRPHGLYGNAFRAATEAQVLDALTVLDPPVRANVIAMAGPYPSVGAYTLPQVEDVLRTAYTAFAAAAAETGQGTVVCSGFWGCGAFGGNRLLMVALQALAARQAGVALRLYAGDRDGVADTQEGLALLAAVLQPTVSGTLAALVARGLRWGVSDGN